MVELLLRAIGDPETTGEDVTIALDRLGRIGVALTTGEGDGGEPGIPTGIRSRGQHTQSQTGDADRARFRNLGEGT